MELALTSPILEFQIFEIVIVVFCGLVLGSFASALTYRVPLGLPWAVKGKSEHGLRSACPACKTLLTPRDLIPLISWLLSRGKCRHCGSKISITYPICELLTLTGVLGIYMVYGLTIFSLPFLIMIPFLTALMMIDFKHMILPNQLVAIVFVLGLCVLGIRLFNDPTVETISIYIGGAVLFAFVSWLLGAVMKKMLKKEALGFGDVKFFAAAGIWLGGTALGSFCIAAGGVGVALGFLWKRVTGEAVFPFGPALILSFYAILLLQGSHFL